MQRPPPVANYSSYSLYLVAWNRGLTNNETILCCEPPDSFIVARNSFVLLKAACSPNPNPRTSGPGLAGHLAFPHEPIHPLNLIHLKFFYSIIIIIIFIRVYTYIQTQWIQTVKKSKQHSIITYMIKFTNV